MTQGHAFTALPQHGQRSSARRYTSIVISVVFEALTHGIRVPASLLILIEFIIFFRLGLVFDRN